MRSRKEPARDVSQIVAFVVEAEEIHSTSRIPEDQAEAVEQTLNAVWGKVIAEVSKPSVADLIRLLQLRQELKSDRAADITVRWVDWEPTFKEE